MSSKAIRFLWETYSAKREILIGTICSSYTPIIVEDVRLTDGVDEEGGEGHEDGDDDEGDLKDFLEDFFALDVGEATLPEQGSSIFLMMVVVMRVGGGHG